MNDREFGAVVAVARDSLVWRAAEAILDAWTAAWRWSGFVTAVGRVSQSIASWRPEVRLRFAALTVVWASVGYGAGLLLLPRYVTSGLPLVWVAMIVVTAGIVAAFPHAFVLAWRDRVVGRKSGVGSRI